MARFEDVGSWPVEVSDGKPVVVCPKCRRKLRIRTLGNAWALARSHVEDHELDYDAAYEEYARALVEGRYSTPSEPF